MAGHRVPRRPSPTGCFRCRIDAGLDGTVAWIVPQVVTPGGGFGISPTGIALYNGVAGIGLFLAAAAVVLDDRRCRAAAMATARSLPDPDSAPTGDIGGMMGRGSVVWALTVMGTLLEEPRLIVDAASWGRGITDEAIDADRTFDLAGGSAGAILALLRLHDTTGDSWPVRSAERCAAHLLAHRTGHPRHGRAQARSPSPVWPTAPRASPMRCSDCTHESAGPSWSTRPSRP